MLDSYILYVNNSATSAIVGRQEGASFVNTLATVTMNPGFEYNGFISDAFTYNGSESCLSWRGPLSVGMVVLGKRFGRAVVNDNDATRIITPGSVGFSGYVESSYRL